MIDELLAALEARRDDTLMVGLDAAGDPDWSQTGAAILARAAAWQSTLRRDGVRPGDRVALDVPRGPDLLPAHVAALASGACVVPVNPALRPAERERMLARADVRTMLTGDDTPAAARAAPDLASPPPGAPALLVFTSGTTGEPKGVPHSLASLRANLEDLARVWQLSAADRLLHVLPAHHVHGLVLALYGSARQGMAIDLAPRFEVPACLRALEHRSTTVLMAVPTIYHRLAEAEKVPHLPRLRVFVSGSAPLSSLDFDAVERRFGHRPVERYGLTETLILTSNPFVGERRAGTVGPALPSTEVEIAADGEILARGPSVLPGYWRSEGDGGDAFDGGRFRTGDLGHFDDAGYLVISGRKKELIIVGGSNVLPGEVECVLAGDPAVDELAVAGVPDADRGEIVGAFIVARPDAPDPAALEARLAALAESELASYKRPRAYRFLDALPRNAMGKVDRKALATLASPAPAAGRRETDQTP